MAGIRGRAAVVAFVVMQWGFAIAMVVTTAAGHQCAVLHCVKRQVGGKACLFDVVTVILDNHR